jgi:hypothetical protein
MKKILNTVSISALFLTAASAFSAPRTIECVARGKSFSNLGAAPLEASANLTFDESFENNIRVINKITGSVKIHSAYGDIYAGQFKIANPLFENVKYRPLRYKDHSQFPEFNATESEGSSESGMWGNLILSKLTSQPKFSAHYILQAGDHIGGTLHLTCQYKN